MVLLIILICCITVTSAQFKDPMQTYSNECLGEGVFECLDGGCIFLDKYCDGNYDCKDASDENFCSNHTADALYCNVTHQFLCADGKNCIPNSWVCNLQEDCEDKSDEINCKVAVTAPNATCKGFTCDGTKCISKFWMCDGEYDCEDKTDEDIETTCRHSLGLHTVNENWYCNKVETSTREFEYSCDDKSICVPRTHMCDGIMDCKDGSDEGGFCKNWHTMCTNFPCNNSKCYPDRSGPYCDCNDEYTSYNYTTHNCESINNCLDDIPWCSHRCEYRNPFFTCVCDEGYSYDRMSYLCYAQDPEAMLFFSTRSEIKYIEIKSKKQAIVATNLKEAHGVAYDGTYVYWVETADGHEAIVRAQFHNVLETKEVIVAIGLEEPGDIAIDWLGGNIFFSDVERGVISVCKSDGSVCSNIRANTTRPRFVTLNPRNGTMYWSDWQHRSVIMTSRMDGSGSEVLVPNLEGYATGLALDAPNDRLYFVDGTIKVVKLFDRKVYSLFEEPFHHPYSIAVFENTVYWSDWTSKTIQATDKIHMRLDKRTVFLTMKEAVFNMHIYHPLLMPESTNPCMNNGCSHICVPTSNTTYTCLCPDGMEIQGRVCKSVPQYRPRYLVVGAGAVFSRVEYGALGAAHTHATHFDVARVQAMAYDLARDTLYIYDGHRKTINNINMSDFTLGVTRLVTLQALDNVVDMGYDYVSDTLYILDAGRKMIDVISLRTKHRTLVYRFKAQEIPISFCVVPEYGKLVVAVLDTELNEISIESIGLDGSDRVHLMTNNVLGPNIRLRYSHEMDIIYIADEGLGVIDFFHPEGTGKANFRVIRTSLANLAVTDTHVFWTDKHTQSLYWGDVQKYDHKIRRMELSIFPNNTLLHLQVTSHPLDPQNPLTKHACYQNPPPCTHICVQTPHPVPQDVDLNIGYKCLCPIGFILEDDGCMELAKCKAQEHYCYKSNECISNSRKCNGVKDCKHGEDEDYCPLPVTDRPIVCPMGQKLCNQRCIGRNEVCKDNTTVACSADHYKCPDSPICIPKNLVCDGAADCPRGTDEAPAACQDLDCLINQFRCASGSCIPVSWKCDGSPDCSDGSDEVQCEIIKCPEDNIQCGSSCYPLSKRCDGHFDCLDASDEHNCDLPELFETDILHQCGIGEFSCEHNSSICLPLTARCNGKVECPGRSDEADCDTRCAPAGMFSCKQEVKCVHNHRVCNGWKDCSDGSDETIEACEKVNKTMAHFMNVYPQMCHNGYRCDDGMCIEWWQVCDNITHCQDGSDEKRLCTSPCKDKCPQFCRSTPRGPTCVCPHGYVSRDGGCADANECETDVCSHVCENTPGSFVCSCYPGYALRSDRRGCKAVSGHTALHASRATVWAHRNNQPYLDYTHPHHIDDFDLDYRNNKLYLAISSTKEIVEINRNSKNYTVASIGNIGTPTKISVDWITGNIYFVDATRPASYIRVCNFGRKVCARLQKLPSNTEVQSLVIDPANQRLFYCIANVNGSVIKYSSLSGRNVSELGSVANCSGLAVDRFGRFLYVLDGRNVLKIDYDGKSRKSVYKNIKNDPHFRSPHGLAFFEDHIYYIDSGNINRCSLYGSKACETLLFNDVTDNYHIYEKNSERVDEENACVDSKCTNVCVGAGVCVCADGAITTSGICPVLKERELLLINGEVQQDAVRHSVSVTLTAVVLVILAIYLCVFLHYRVVKKWNRNGNYMQVRYQNRPEGATELTNAFIEVPTTGGIGHQFVNPLMYVRNMWPESFTRSKPIGTAGITFDTQQDLSDTESDLDVRETKRMLRNR